MVLPIICHHELLFLKGLHINIHFLLLFYTFLVPFYILLLHFSCSSNVFCCAVPPGCCMQRMSTCSAFPPLCTAIATVIQIFMVCLQNYPNPKQINTKAFQSRKGCLFCRKWAWSLNKVVIPIFCQCQGVFIQHVKSCLDDVTVVHILESKGWRVLGAGPILQKKVKYIK